MITSPASPYQQLSQPATEFQVWLSNDGFPPVAANFGVNLYPISAHLTASGKRDDVLLVHNLTPAPIANRGLTGGDSFLGRQIDIRAIDDNGDPNIVIAWGVICRQPILLDGDANFYAYEARIGDEHFGDRLEKWPTWDSVAEDTLEVMLPLVFNPEIDGTICPNMSDKIDDTNEWHYFLHPESTRTDAAKEYQEQEPSRWKLSDAVLFLSWWLNDGETYIANPTQADVTAAFADRDDLLRNVSIPIGASLPTALDLLLGPLEYSWHLVHGLDDDGLRITYLRFYQRGKGPSKQLYLQKPGETRDIGKSNVLALDLMVSVVDLANRVICYGDYEKREVTVELQKCWDPALDETRLADLRESSDFSKAHPEVMRKWILDTGADYIGLRPELVDPEVLHGVFSDDLLVMRRKFLRCLSQHPDGDDTESNGFRVEWWNKYVPLAVTHTVKTDPGWIKVKWPFSVLEKECGIVFDGDAVPLQLWTLIYNGTPDDAHVRITATITGDVRVKGDAVRQATSSNGVDIILTLDVSDRFQNSKVDTSTPYGSIFSADPTDARDDTAAILTYAQQIRTAEDAIRLDTSIPLEGALHPEYQIGDVLPNVTGRNLDLTLAANRWPQVVGIVYHFQGQQVELLLESFRKERPRVVLSNKALDVVGAEAPRVARRDPLRRVTAPGSEGGAGLRLRPGVFAGSVGGG